MILQNSQPATTPDAGHLATPAPALSLPADTACLIRPDYTSPQLLNMERAQSAHTGAAQQQHPETADSSLTDNAFLLHLDNVPLVTPPVEATHQSIAQPLQTSAEQLLHRDSTQLLLNPDDVEQPSSSPLLSISTLLSSPESFPSAQQSVQAQLTSLTHRSREDDAVIQNNARAIQKITSDLEKLKEKLTTKDMEIDVLNTEVKTAYSVIDQLQQKICNLENIIANKPPPHQQAETDSSPNLPQKILLLGDENWTEAKVSDLNKNVSIRTIKGANTDLLRCWVSEKLNWIPSKCVIYCGLQDIINNTAPEIILDNFTSLIAELKDKNNDMDIYVCQLAPTLLSQDTQAKIGDFNEHLRIWCDLNNISVIKTEPVFKLGTGEVDDMCYDMEGVTPGSILNRIGIIRLLTFVTKQCPHFSICKDIERLKKTPQNALTSPIFTNNQHNRNRNQTYLPSNSTDHHYNNSHSAEGGPARQIQDTWAAVVRRNNARPPANNTPTLPKESPNPHHLRHRTPIHNRFSRLHETHVDNHNINNFNSRNRAKYNNPSQKYGNNYMKKVGGYNCGEFNHRQSTCRFDHKL